MKNGFLLNDYYFRFRKKKYAPLLSLPFFFLFNKGWCMIQNFKKQAHSFWRADSLGHKTQILLPIAASPRCPFFLDSFSLGKWLPLTCHSPFHLVLVSVASVSPETSNMHVLLWSLDNPQFACDNAEVFFFKLFYSFIFHFEAVSLELYNFPHFQPLKKSETTKPTKSAKWGSMVQLRK